MGSGNGQTGTQKLNRYVLEDFNPCRSEEAAGDASSREPSDAELREDLRAGDHEPVRPLHAVREERPEVARIERRSPADAYKPLHDFLETFDTDTVMISFAALENMIKRKLPPSARERETWWTNKPRGRGHAKAWLDIGWQVDRVDLRKGRVTFTRL